MDRRAALRTGRELLTSASARDRRLRSLSEGALDEFYEDLRRRESLELTALLARGRLVYVPKSHLDRLQLQVANTYMRDVLQIKQSDRSKVVRLVKAVLNDSFPGVVVRTDIESFYSSIERDLIVERAKGHLTEAPGVVHMALNAYRNATESGGAGIGRGLPRGLALSAALAEFRMASVDAKLSAHPSVMFYLRYVDDIFACARGGVSENEIVQRITAELSGQELGRLELNAHKTRTLKLGSSKKQSVEYLGYEFALSENGLEYIDISNAKVARLKYKLSLAVASYVKRGDFSLLNDRLRVLTSNYSLPREHSQHRPLAGIYYSYPEVDRMSGGALDSLDKFLHGTLSGSCGRLAKAIAARIDKPEREALSKLSFRKGFERRVRWRFSTARLNEIRRCWKNV